MITHIDPIKAYSALWGRFTIQKTKEPRKIEEKGGNRAGDTHTDTHKKSTIESNNKQEQISNKNFRKFYKKSLIEKLSTRMGR